MRDGIMSAITAYAMISVAAISMIFAVTYIFRQDTSQELCNKKGGAYFNEQCIKAELIDLGE